MAKAYGLPVSNEPSRIILPPELTLLEPDADLTDPLDLALSGLRGDFTADENEVVL